MLLCAVIGKLRMLEARADIGLERLQISLHAQQLLLQATAVGTASEGKAAQRSPAVVDRQPSAAAVVR